MATTYPQVRIPATEMRPLSSSHVDQEFRILVGLPETYNSSDKTYPVLYLLDGNCYFGTTVETVRMSALHQELPEMIVVGIGYPVDTITETAAVRIRDYTPGDLRAWWERTCSPFPECPTYAGSGKAADFLRFVYGELMPAIHSDYRADAGNRTIIGHSAGGVFGLYTLFHRPQTFQRYVIASPPIRWEGMDLFRDEEEFAASHSDLAATVFISAGALEEPEDSMVSNMRRLAETLKGRNYPSLAITTHVFEDETHDSVIPASISRGMRRVFS